MSYFCLNKEYKNVFLLAKDIYKNYDAFINIFRTDDNLLAFIKENDERKYESIIKLKRLAYPDDVFLFKATYILNPYLNFRIRNRSYRNYEQLGEALLYTSPSIDAILFQLIQFDLISYHMEVSSFSSKYSQIYNDVKEIEQIQDKQFAYFKMAYYLSKKDVIVYDNKMYNSLYTFCLHILKNTDDIELLGSNLTSAPFLRAYSELPPHKDSREYIALCDELNKNENKLKSFLEKKGRSL